MSCKRIYGMATRDAYGKALVELGRENPAIVALDADLSKSTKSVLFAKEFKDRFFNMGIAEANMVSTAAGLASCGKIPFVSSFASFLMCKTFDQLRMSVANPHLNVKLVGSHGGISIGEDGASQMAVEDIALACSLPGFVVLVPADELSTMALVKLAAQHKGPVYMRTGRPKAPVIYQQGTDFKIGRANIVREGIDVTVIANGLMVQEAVEAACACSERGIDVRVIDMHTVKPIDKDVIVQSAQTTGAIVTAEEHLLAGGLGAAVAQVVSEQCPVPMGFVGVNDTYAESGTPDELFRKYGLTADNIVRKIEEVLKRK
ncbi:MAG: transketolase family protein [Nitrospirae bacterium]|nr:transketolase family protein [Nitrospirota bacterium]